MESMYKGSQAEEKEGRGVVKKTLKKHIYAEDLHLNEHTERPVEMCCIMGSWWLEMLFQELSSHGPN